MRFIIATALVGSLLPGHDTAAQPPSPPPGAPAPTLRVFVDCPDGCDSTYIRTELNFVDHVRDRKVADVHILITESDTGGGGTEYTVSLIGLGRFEGIKETLKHVSRPGDTDDDERRGILRAIKLGLVRYLATTPLADRLEVIYRPPEQETAGLPGQTTVDRWDFWVFRVEGDVDTEGEESSTSLELDGSFSATRVTEQWKSAATLDYNYRRSRYSLQEEGEEDYISITRDSSVGGTLVKTLGSHWGGGAALSLSSSTYTNHRHLFRVSPAIEYNIFPYAETTRRQLTFTYSIGVFAASYREVTLYGKMNEWLANHALAVNWDMKQPWGTIDVEVEASQYLPDTHKNRLSVEADIEVRLFKGFSLDIGARTSLIHDLLYLPAGEATDEEILLKLRQLATSYDYGFRVGFSYSFGSVYNNVVNSRLSKFF